MKHKISDFLMSFEEFDVLKLIVDVKRKDGKILNMEQLQFVKNWMKKSLKDFNAVKNKN